jgi:hypothetical protein
MLLALFVQYFSSYVMTQLKNGSGLLISKTVRFTEEIGGETGTFIFLCRFCSQTIFSHIFRELNLRSVHEYRTIFMSSIHYCSLILTKSGMCKQLASVRFDEKYMLYMHMPMRAHTHTHTHTHTQATSCIVTYFHVIPSALQNHSKIQ